MLTMLLLAAAFHPEPPAPPAPTPGRQVVNEVVVIRSGDAKDDAKAKVERRQVMIIRDGKAAPGSAAHDEHIRRIEGANATVLADCDNGSRFDSQASGEKDGKKSETRILVCTKGGNQLEALERAHKRIAENKNIPDDVRAKVLAQMDARIAQLKSGQK